MSSLQQQSKDDSVEPVDTQHGINNLCATCSSAFLKARSSHDVLKRMFQNCDESQLLVHDRLAKESFRHHSSFHKLRAASGFGCHLCNLIELYCTGFSVDPDLPVWLKLDLRGKGDRKYSFNVSTGERRTEVQLGMVSTDDGVSACRVVANVNADSHQARTIPAS
jgi:hypothetical protein